MIFTFALRFEAALANCLAAFRRWTLARFSCSVSQRLNLENAQNRENFLHHAGKIRGPPDLSSRKGFLRG
jgi:hypothetical protein